jgi:SAM-dependent methyltransferase
MGSINQFLNIFKKKKNKPAYINFKEIGFDSCFVCDAPQFHYTPVLWEKLTLEWGLLPHEIDYINRQQGLHCVNCKNNFRALALANTLMKAFNFKGILADFVKSDTFLNLKSLEINDCAFLNKYLSHSKNHIIKAYPDIDMQNISYPENSFDIVLHSDTLEHVPDPLLAMQECARILKPNGVCIFTTPVIYDRKTKSRKNLPLSYHGGPTTTDEGYIVQTEFGEDIWHYLKDSGFKSVYTEILEFPAAIAYVGVK